MKGNKEAYSIQGETLQSIASAIRTKTGQTSEYTPLEMIEAINSIPVGGEDLKPEDIQINIEESGLITAQVGDKKQTKQIDSTTDLDLIPENIRKDVEIFGVGGNLIEGIPLNFQIVGSFVENFDIESNTPPIDNLMENTIWINTDTPIERWVIDNAPPSDLSVGDVWIPTHQYAVHYFNTLRYDQGVVVRPMQARQWNGEAFITKETWLYQNGTWLKPMNLVGVNSWDFKKYAAGNSTPYPADFVGKEIVATNTYHDLQINISMAIGDKYSAVCTTYLWFDEATTLSISYTTDDGGSVTLNDTLVGTLASCTAKSLSCNFQAGWNKLVVCYTEGNGGDGWVTNPKFSNHQSVGAMYASIY